MASACGAAGADREKVYPGADQTSVQVRLILVPVPSRADPATTHPPAVLSTLPQIRTKAMHRCCNDDHIQEPHTMDRRNRSNLTVSRRESLRLSMGLVFGALGAWGTPPQAQAGGEDFSHWVESFRARARARGVSDAIYTHVMHGLKPDTEVFDLQRDQPE